MLPRINPTKTKAWARLAAHQAEIGNEHMRSWFLNDPLRFSKFSLEVDDILFDFSKNRITKTTLSLLQELFEECKVAECINLQFEGAAINETENRAVLHTALRNFSGRPVVVDGEDVMPAIQKVLAQMQQFSENLLNGSWKGHTGKRITDVVNIGIGGSDLGPVMVYEALKPYHRKEVKCHFVSNIDGADISETLALLNPETTLFIIASKTFTTQETMTNAHTARRWFLDSKASESSIEKHFVAVSTNTSAVKDFGIDTANMFEFWDWVGGRYSVWSAIGLSLCCGLGYANFEKFLKGAHAMDEHFRKKPFEENAPMIMAAIGIWYVNFWNAASEAIIPYYQNMHRFAAYFQQGNMESNGKSVDRNGEPVNYNTGPIVWGEPGTNGQHAFFQLIHQGTHLIPCDFIGFAQTPYKVSDHHAKFMANFFAQTEALMRGKTEGEVRAEMNITKDSPFSETYKIPFKVFEGNHPTTSILAQSPDPETLGKLVACYEHKIFVQGVVWNIFSYDQWGVELGKQLAKNILPKLTGEQSELGVHDNSTEGLIRKFRDMNKPSTS